MTLVTIFLPLSSIWAGTALDHARGQLENGHRLWNLLSFWESQKSRQISTGSATGTSANTCYSAPSSKQNPDLDAERGICVEREVSVYSHQRGMPSAV